MPPETKRTTGQEWLDDAGRELVGKKISEVRYMTKEEAEAISWYRRPLMIIFEDGGMIFASSDDEGNDGGTMFGQSADGEELTFPGMR